MDTSSNNGEALYHAAKQRHRHKTLLHKALRSAAKHHDSPSIGEALSLINEGGKDLLMNFSYLNEPLLNSVIKMDVPLEIIYKMIEIGGKDFVMKTNYDNGYTPLHIVFDNGSPYQLVPKLLEVGGNDLVMKRTKEDGQTALHCAYQTSRYNQENEDYDRAIATLLEYGGKELVMTRDGHGETLLFYAAKPLKTLKKIIDVGGSEFLEQKNHMGKLAVQDVLENGDYEDNIEILVFLIKEGVYLNIGGEFSLGGLLCNSFYVEYDTWLEELFPALFIVLREIYKESPNKILPLLHSMIMAKAPKFVIVDILNNVDSYMISLGDTLGLYEGVTSVKDSLGRCAIDLAIEMNLPFGEGTKEILEATAKTNGLDILHCAAQYGLPWNNGMEGLVLENLDETANGVNKETGLKLFMTAAIGGNLDAIYSLVRMDPVCIFIETKNVMQSNNIARLSIGNRENTNIRVTNVNQGALKKVLKYGREKKKDEKLVQRRQARQQRMLATRKAMYEELYSKYDDDKEFEMYEYINKF